ncbi:MAG TPA: hypothetical protein VIZ64_10290, partial [Dokdonella sp.]
MSTCVPSRSVSVQRSAGADAVVPRPGLAPLVARAGFAAAARRRVEVGLVVRVLEAVRRAAFAVDADFGVGAVLRVAFATGLRAAVLFAGPFFV